MGWLVDLFNYLFLIYLNLIIIHIYLTIINQSSFKKWYSDNCQRRGREYPAPLGISASLTIPYLLLRALTSNKAENFNSKDKQLYEKVYFKEHKKRKYKNIIISNGVTALTAGGVIYYLLDNMSFNPGAFGPNRHCCF